MPRGRAPKLNAQEAKELKDLYVWGASMADMCMLYGLTAKSVRACMRRENVDIRPKHRPSFLPKRIKSSHEQTHEYVEGETYRSTADQLLRSSAHAQRDKRTEAHQ